MKTALILMTQYDGLAVIPLDLVCRDYFHLTVDKFTRKVMAGEISLPIVRMEEGSQKTARGVHIADLAAYLDKRADAARRECDQLKATA